MTSCTAPNCTDALDGDPTPATGWRVTADGALCPEHAREQNSREIEAQRLRVWDDSEGTDPGEEIGGSE